MQRNDNRRLQGRGRAINFRSSCCAAALLTAGLAPALADDNILHPGNLVVTRTVYDNTNPPNITAGVTQLPPGCPVALADPPTCSAAVSGHLSRCVQQREHRRRLRHDIEDSPR